MFLSSLCRLCSVEENKEPRTGSFGLTGSDVDPQAPLGTVEAHVRARWAMLFLHFQP